MKGYRIVLHWRREKERRELHSADIHVNDITPVVELLKLAVFPPTFELSIEDLSFARAQDGEADRCQRCNYANSPINSNCSACGKAMKPGATDINRSEDDF